jgi:capsular exopolysaccharide synthesis family protein
LSNTFAEQLIVMMETEALEGSEADANELRQQMAALEKEIDRLEQRIAASPETAGVLEAQRDARLNSYGVLTDQVEQLESGAVASIGLEIVERGVGAPSDAGGLQAPRSLPARLALAAILGFLLGVAVVLVMEHMDMRIKDKSEAEEQFDLPVLAEIPVIPRKRRSELAVTEDQAREPVGDSFRFLTAALSLSSAVKPSEVQKSGDSDRVPSGISDDPPQVILVTSSAPAEGKTTVVANLAAAFGELGQRVVVFSCDFQRPAIHEFFGLDNKSGLANALEDRHTNSILNGHVRDSGVPNVRIIPSGPFIHNPRELLTSKEMHLALDEARKDADVILIDTAPLLAAGEATLLFPEVDGVLIVSRAGRTTPDAAERARDVLKRLDAPMLGVVLNAAEGSGVPYYYYPLRERRRGLSRLSNR